MKTVLCHGCFDLLHAGHLKHFEKAKEYGDRLIVSITADRYVNKGPGRPYFTEQRRADMLRALSIVDEVYVCEHHTAIPAIERFKPDFYIKGQDYNDASKDVTGEIVNEKAAVESYGGKLVFTDEETHSSSEIINRFFAGWTDEQKAAIEAVRAAGGILAARHAIEKLSSLRVLVVGEPILDIYRFVKAEGISSKSPSISCRFIRSEEYAGGAWAITKHLHSFCDADMLTVDRTCMKTRYISDTQRVFEVTDIDETPYPWAMPSEKYDVIVAADFGHGMFQGGELDGRTEFIGLNVQTNSSNFGYNVYTKHKRFDYLCLDTREARLAEHDRYGVSREIAQTIANRIARPFGFTEGANGASLYQDGRTYQSPAFSDVVIDATGAGDAYFAITTLLLATDCNPVLVPFIGNVFAGLKTKIIGNKEAVSKASLIKACSGILK